MSALRAWQLEKTQGGFVATVSVALDPTPRLRIVQKNAGSSGSDAIYVDGWAYSKTNAAPWQRRRFPGLPGVIASLAPISHSVPTVLPDVDVDGVAVGRVRLAGTIPPSALPPGLTQADLDKYAELIFFTCSYSKTTYLLDTCSKVYPDPQSFVMRYDLPPNTFDVPPEARNATELPPLSLPKPG